MTPAEQISTELPGLFLLFASFNLNSWENFPPSLASLWALDKGYCETLL